MRTLFAFIFTALLCSATSSTFAQCSGRYYDKVFPEPNVFINLLGIPLADVTKLSPYKVTYGNVDGRNLEMYVFQPDGDNPGSPYYQDKRPLVILAYGGSFTAGFKESPDIIRLCQQFTARGYVTASIDYRLLPGSAPIDSANMLNQVVKAVQDAKAAIRFFYKDAATTNTYRIDTNHIYAGGTSAGAFIGVHLGYLTDTAGVQQWMKDIIAAQGELEGNSGNPGYSSRIHGVINLAGAIGDTSWIEPGDVPMVSMHGNQDGTVPYCSEIINVGGNDIIVVDGSATMKLRTAHLGIYNPFYTWRDADHVPYVDPQPSSEGPVYMDTTIWFVRDFLFHMVTGNDCGQTLASTGYVESPCGVNIPTSLKPDVVAETLSAYPNPSSDIIFIDMPSTYSGSVDVEIYNEIGKLVKTYGKTNEKISINKKDLGTGLFIVKVIPSEKGTQAMRAKIVLN